MSLDEVARMHPGELRAMIAETSKRVRDECLSKMTVDDGDDVLGDFIMLRNGLRNMLRSAVRRRLRRRDSRFRTNGEWLVRFMIEEANADLKRLRDLRRRKQ